ncbi:MAG: NfeD family protein [Ruminococcus sp.]|nr:NfeD family protein [Ruminococcus sp.]MDY3895346.1 NfeD family protein [Candidatus Fimenecus sp.]
MGFTVTGLTVLWSVLLILFIIAEAVTVQLVSIWFAVGSLAALISNLCGAGTLLQAALFVGVSFAALLLTRPLVKKFSSPKIQRTNLDRIIGERAIVTEEIDNLRAIGIVKADGKSWTARSADGSIIPTGSVVEVEKIDGVKLIVGLIQNK